MLDITQVGLNVRHSLTSAMLGSNHSADRADKLHMLCRVGTAQHSSVPPRRPSPSTAGHPEFQREVVVKNVAIGNKTRFLFFAYSLQTRTARVRFARLA